MDSNIENDYVSNTLQMDSHWRIFNILITDDRDLELIKFLKENWILNLDIITEKKQIKDNISLVIWNTFNKIKTFNSSALFLEYLKKIDLNNAEILLFESRTWKIDLEELKKFLILDWIKWKVLPYKINWHNWTIIFLIELWININKNISPQEASKEKIKNKYNLMKLIKSNWFFLFNLFLSSQLSHETNNSLNFNVPIIVFTWPRWAGKNYFAEKILNLFNEYVGFVKQVSCRNSRIDDDVNYIKTVTSYEFNIYKDNMWVNTWKYWILNSDLDVILKSWKIPLLILWWKEIIKIKKKSKRKIIVINITYPIEMGWKLNNYTTEKIINERLNWRWLNLEELDQYICSINKYMQLFFNHPTFRKLFSYNYDSIKWNENEFLEYFKQLILATINN